MLDLVGAEATLALAMQVARPLSQVALVGIAGGSHPFSSFTQPYEVSMSTTYWGTLPELIEVLALAEAGHVAAHVQRFGLEDAVDAYRQLAAGELTGRAVIVP